MSPFRYPTHQPKKHWVKISQWAERRQTWLRQGKRHPFGRHSGYRFLLVDAELFRGADSCMIMCVTRCCLLVKEHRLTLDVGCIQSSVSLLAFIICSPCRSVFTKPTGIVTPSLSYIVEVALCVEMRPGETRLGSDKDDGLLLLTDMSI